METVNSVFKVLGEAQIGNVILILGALLIFALIFGPTVIAIAKAKWFNSEAKFVTKDELSSIEKRQEDYVKHVDTRFGDLAKLLQTHTDFYKMSIQNQENINNYLKDAVEAQNNSIKELASKVDNGFQDYGKRLNDGLDKLAKINAQSGSSQESWDGNERRGT